MVAGVPEGMLWRPRAFEGCRAGREGAQKGVWWKTGEILRMNVSEDRREKREMGGFLRDSVR